MSAPWRPWGPLLRSHLRTMWLHRRASTLQTMEGAAGGGPSQAVAPPQPMAPPRSKAWAKEAVLEALAATVSRDPTACAHQFQDDPYLSPRNSAEFKLYSLSQESGRAAAQFFVNRFPRFFTKDFAEPHIPCLMPEEVATLRDEVSEEALRERVRLRNAEAAVQLYDQLLQAGTAPSPEVTQELLDLLCFYGDTHPAAEAQTEDVAASEKPRPKKAAPRQAAASAWREDNHAERIFQLLPERGARAYCSLIRGMVKHGAKAKAFSLYTDLLNSRLAADVHTFNALISATPDVRDKFTERWDLISELLKQMREQQVAPTLLTFNAVLKAVRFCGHLARPQALQTLSEMAALGVAPSLASYHHVLAVFYKAASPGHSNADVLQEVMSKVAGSSLRCQDPEDVLFFSHAMKICLENKDLELGYSVHSLVAVGDNWRLLGDAYRQSLYYGRFFSLLCMMEHVDVVLDWYRRLVPSVYYPKPQAMKDLLQALDADSRLDLLPAVWRDICSLGHNNKEDVVEELLSLMARDQHAPQVQEQFAQCAVEVKAAFDGDRGRPALEWSTSSLTSVTSLLLRGNQPQQAWDVLQLFGSKNRVPPEGLLEDFLQACCRDQRPQRAVDLLLFCGSFCLPATPRLASTALAQLELTEEQRALLSELEASAQPCD